MTQSFVSNLINITFNVFYFLVLARVLISWIPQIAHNAFGKFIFEVTEPLLAPIRRILPRMGAIDFSPLVVLIILQILQSLLSKYF